MTATFILSFDCEGKWGVADCLDSNAHQQLTDERLQWCYREVIARLSRYDVVATFAFVGLFSQGNTSFSNLRPLVEKLAGSHSSYLIPALSDIDVGSRQGWQGDWAVDLVATASQDHEVAFHGSSHIPWDELNQRELATELEIFSALEGPVRSSKTMIFPRNRVAHQDQLAKAGLQGYRAARVRSRAVNLLSEFNLFARSDRRSEPLATTRIPAGYFVNYQYGLRKLVPRQLSRIRAEHIFAHAVRTDGVVHFWLHPENIASAPTTMGHLEDILCLAARERDRGRCVIQTQLDYCNDPVSEALSLQ